MIGLGLLAIVIVALLAYGWFVGVVLAVISAVFLRWPRQRPSAPAVLTQEEEAAIELLRKGRPLKSSEVSQLRDFLCHAFGNIDLNRRCLSRKRALGKYDPEKVLLLQDVATFAYKSSVSKNFEELMQRAENVWRLWQSGKTIKDSDRIRKEDLRSLESSVNFHTLISRLDSLGGLEGEMKLEQLRNWTQRADCWHREVLKELVQQGPEYVPQTGDLIAFTLENNRFVRGKRHNFVLEWFYLCLGSDATHMALAFQNKDENELFESHMW